MRWSGSVTQLHRTYSSNSTAPYHGCMLRAFDGFRKLGALSGNPYKKDCAMMAHSRMATPSWD